MSVFLFALALLTADVADAPESAPPRAATPPGAPSDDYGLVAWCYGTLGGYLDLHDEVMPEVTRIERTYRKPGTRLEDDLKVYADLQKESRTNLALFARAIAAAEKASLRPISDRGADAVRKGRSVWTAASTMSKARVAQEWMSWSLPAVCVSTAQSLEARASLLGATFDPSETGVADSPEALAPEAPVAEGAPGGPPPADGLEATARPEATGGDTVGEEVAVDDASVDETPDQAEPIADNRLLAPSEDIFAPTDSPAEP